jgi:hypothetical protein
MAKGDYDGEDLKPDGLVEHLAPDPSALPDVQILVGFLGKSVRAGCWRLYTTAVLNEYVEFTEDDLVHHRSLSPDESQLGGTVVWLKRGTNLQRTRMASREAQADFLQGAIAMRRNPALGRGPEALGVFGAGGPATGVSAVREFCDFKVSSWLAGGDVFCTGSFECMAPSWAAECG